MSELRGFEVPAGTMRYLDRGEGAPIVLVHGNPSSSHEFEGVVELLGDGYRCIAPDHIGFGASAKPADWDYLPESHAANLAALLDSLDLQGVTLVVGDWGGPIGLSWALDNPERVAAVVVTNTWLWPVNRSLYYQGFSKFMGGPLGRFLTTRYNFFAKQVTRRAWGRARPLTPELLERFTGVHTRPEERKGMWVFPRQITGSTDWLRSLWERRDSLREADMALLWGMRDIAFREDVLERWIAEFPDAAVARLPEAGHFVSLEAPEAVAAAVRARR